MFGQPNFANRKHDPEARSRGSLVSYALAVVAVGVVILLGYAVLYAIGS